MKLAIRHFLATLSNRSFSCSLICCCSSLLTYQSLGQNVEDTIVRWIQPVEVTAARLNLQDLKTPFAVSVISLPIIQEANSSLNLQEILGFTPGLIAMNGYNYAQDVRISLRGYGSRAAFGVRGIKMFLDDIPVTSPDGQTQLDHIEAGMLKRVEVIKGPSSGIYGNASGGIISLYTGPEEPGFSLTTRFGENQFYSLSGNFAETTESLSFSGTGIFSSYNGYRSFSGIEQRLFHGKLAWRPGKKSEVKITLNLLDSPKADDPGGLTSSEVNIDPRQASPRNVLFNAGESVTQGIAGFRWKYDWNESNSVTLTSHYTYRDFENRLPFEDGGQVDLKRNFGGWDIHWSSKKELLASPFILSAGIDLEDQKDVRRRYDNLEGDRGELSFDQTERFKSLGVYSSQEVSLHPRWQLLTRFRFDLYRLEVSDVFLSDGDASDEIKYNRFSPMFGINYQFTPSNHTYLTLSHGFEAPTLIELSNNPDDAGGFNPDLSPQKSWNYEWGIKGILGTRLKYELALYHISLRDESVPFEKEGQPGRSFYRNSGKSTRNGLETGVQVHLNDAWTVWMNYTYSDFKFREFQLEGLNLSGNRTPGIPVHYSQLFLHFKSGKLQIAGEYNYYDAIYADDSNSILSKPTNLFHFRTSMEVKGNLNWKIFAGIRNLFNTDYNQNIRINAAANRFYEPGPSRFFYAGIQIQKIKKDRI